MCMDWPWYCFIDGHSNNALMCRKKVKLIHHDCLPILMLLHIMLCIMLAYLMLFFVLSNAACLYRASFLLLLILQVLFVSCFVLVY